jgi:hypothetical protein
MLQAFCHNGLKVFVLIVTTLHFVVLVLVCRVRFALTIRVVDKSLVFSKIRVSAGAGYYLGLVPVTSSMNASVWLLR